MNYGFVIDERSCIGCHACSTACKSENQVPLGVNRTWVKYTEVGAFPDVTRNFQVSRCNHCSNPPCVRICPVTAMYQRHDGIVEFDSDVCIGCKACMQACPYDAIYIDPETHTAAKCHFCAHRVENGVEPACVVVCPTHSIIAGDLDDPDSEIAKTVAQNPVTVRKPEQGTAPKLFYIHGSHAGLVPTAGERSPDQMIWADTIAEDRPKSPGYAEQRLYQVHLDMHAMGGQGGHVAAAETPRTTDKGTLIRTPQTQGDPVGGPINVSPGRMAEQMVQVAYNAQHKVPWHWPVPAYLVTKGIGAGIFLLLAIAALTGMEPSAGTIAIGGGLAVLMTLLTTVFLVMDLDRPERFLSIIFRPQWKSWLARGAFILIAFSTVTGIWWALGAGAAIGLLPDLGGVGNAVFALVTIPLAIGAAIYTAFLFAQAEGRDLWQSPMLPIHLLVQSVMMGGAGLLLVAPFLEMGAGLTALATVALGGGLVLDLFLLLAGEFGIPHPSEVAARAAHDITQGRFKKQFWMGAIGIGHVLPLVLLGIGVLFGAGFFGFVAGIAAIVGLYAYEHAFVMAPQLVPNS